MKRIQLYLVMLMAALFAAGEASAHQVSLSYISVGLVGESPSATIKVSFLDLEVANGIDQDFDGKITWKEAKAGLDQITTYLLSRTAVTAGGPCTLTRQGAEPVQQNGEGYLSLAFAVDCPDPAQPVDVASTVFFEIDPTSRILVSSQQDSGDKTYVIGVSDKPGIAPTLERGAAPQPGTHEASLLSYFQEGVSHLFGGPDHMLFLLVLIVPAIFAKGGLKGVAIAALLPITGFTLGHALTLTSAASGLVRPPAQLVEILIAITILLTAIDNVRRFIPGPRSVVAFLFGLIHGFGFASALGALDVSGWQLGIALLGFNLGIETGQAILALSVAPLLYLVREPAKRYHLMPLGLSAVAGIMAVFWIAERTGLIG